MRCPLVHNSPPGSTRRRVRPKLTLVLPLLMLAIGLGVAVGYAAQISRSLAGSIDMNLVSAESFADVDRSGLVDDRDLLSIVASLNTRPESDVAQDMNKDGVVDLLDLVFAAINFGRRF